MENKKLTPRILTDIGIISRFKTPFVYEIGKTGVTVDLQYHAWPSACVDENGVVYAFASGRLCHIDPFGQTLMYKSYDNGETWSEPTVVNDTPMDDRDVGAAYLGNGRILITYFRTTAWDLMTKEQSFVNVFGEEIKGIRSAEKNEAGDYVDEFVRWQNPRFTTPEQIEAVFDFWKSEPRKNLVGGKWYLLSEDYGKTWSDPISIPISAPHGPMVRRDGSLLYVGRGELEGIGPDGIYAMTSHDGGKSWQYLSTIHENSTLMLCEPHVTELKSGRLVVGIRAETRTVRVGDTTYYAAQFDATGIPLGKTKDGDKRYFIADNLSVLEVADRLPHTNYRLYTCYSDDGGLTWTTPMRVEAKDPTGLEVTAGQPYGTPPHMLTMDHDEVVMTYCARNFEIGQRAIISYDGGKTWDKEIILCNKPHDTEPGSPYRYIWGDIGYPATVRLADGNLLTVYYQAYTGDPYCSFLYTKWSLE